MKCANTSVELVTEYAKDLTWENRFNVLKDQLYIFGKQQRRVDRLRMHNIEFVITDGPSLLGLIYYNAPHEDKFTDLAIAMYNENNNVNYFIERSFEYDPVGRTQTEEESVEVDIRVEQMLINNNIPYTTVKAHSAIDDILSDIQEEIYSET